MKNSILLSMMTIADSDLLFAGGDIMTAEASEDAFSPLICNGDVQSMNSEEVEFFVGKKQKNEIESAYEKHPSRR